MSTKHFKNPEKFATSLIELASSKECKVCSINGASGAGKSYLVKKLQHLVIDETTKIKVYDLDWFGVHSKTQDGKSVWHIKWHELFLDADSVNCILVGTCNNWEEITKFVPRHELKNIFLVPNKDTFKRTNLLKVRDSESHPEWTILRFAETGFSPIYYSSKVTGDYDLIAVISHPESPLISLSQRGWDNRKTNFYESALRVANFFVKFKGDSEAHVRTEGEQDIISVKITPNDIFPWTRQLAVQGTELGSQSDYFAFFNTWRNIINLADFNKVNYIDCENSFRVIIPTKTTLEFQEGKVNWTLVIEVFDNGNFTFCIKATLGKFDIKRAGYSSGPRSVLNQDKLLIVKALLKYAFHLFSSENFIFLKDGNNLVSSDKPIELKAPSLTNGFVIARIKKERDPLHMFSEEVMEFMEASINGADQMPVIKTAGSSDYLLFLPTQLRNGDLDRFFHPIFFEFFDIVTTLGYFPILREDYLVQRFLLKLDLRFCEEGIIFCPGDDFSLLNSSYIVLPYGMLSYALSSWIIYKRDKGKILSPAKLFAGLGIAFTLSSTFINSKSKLNTHAIPKKR